MHAGIIGSGAAITHGGTFLSHPVATSAALATQRYILEEGITQYVDDTGRYLQELLSAHCGSLTCVGDIRGRGFFQGVEFVREPGKKTPLSRGVFATEVARRALDDGLMIYPGGGLSSEGTGDHVLIAPAYIATPTDLEAMVMKLSRAIKTTWSAWRTTQQGRS